MSRCKSCGASIVWALTALGKSIPLDPAPVAAGNLVIAGGVLGTPQASVRYLTKGETPPADQARFVSHFSTCPNAAEHRRRAS